MLSFKTDKHSVSPCHTHTHTHSDPTEPPAVQQHEAERTTKQLSINSLQWIMSTENFGHSGSFLPDDSCILWWLIIWPCAESKAWFYSFVPVEAITSRCSRWPFKVYLSIFTLTQIVIKVELSALTVIHLSRGGGAGLMYWWWPSKFSANSINAYTATWKSQCWRVGYYWMKCSITRGPREDAKRKEQKGERWGSELNLCVVKMHSVWPFSGDSSWNVWLYILSLTDSEQWNQFWRDEIHEGSPAGFTQNVTNLSWPQNHQVRVFLWWMLTEIS